MTGTEKLILLLAGSLLVWGLLFVWSASFYQAQIYCNDLFCFARHQFLFGVLPGIILGFISWRLFPGKEPFKTSLVLFLLALLLNFLVFVPGIGVEKGGAKRWVEIGGISFQPSEFLKLAFILYFSALLTSPRLPKAVWQIVSFLPLFVLLFYFQRDKGTLFLMISLFFIMAWLSRRIKTLDLGITFLLTLIAGILLILSEPYSKRRVLSFFNPSEDPLGSNWQVKQGLIAIGSGGWLGQGIGLSRQKLGFLPASFTDSIFAVIAEETGLIGAIFTLLLFFLLFLTLYKLATRLKHGKRKEEFYRLIIFGVITHWAVQTFFNMGSVLKVSFFTGIPLPFISYGATHLVVELIETGIVLKIAGLTKPGT